METDPRPLEMMNALIAPLYERLTEADAFDGVADELVELQLRLLREAGYDIVRDSVRVSETAPRADMTNALALENQRLRERTIALTQTERDFLEEVFDDSIEDKRVYGGNTAWLVELRRKVLG